MFRIGEFSKICQISARMLRHYEQLGLFHPARVDEETGYRYYTVDQIPRLNRILALKDLGLTLEEVARLVDAQIEAAEIRGMLRLKQSQLQQHIRAEQERLTRVQSRLHQIEQEGREPEYEVVLKHIQPQMILGLREVAPTLEQMGSLLILAHHAVQRSGLKTTLPGLAVFYDVNYEERHVDWEIGFPVEPDDSHRVITLDDDKQSDRKSDRQLVARTLPGVDLMACLVYPGAYWGLHRGYSDLGTWIARSGYTLSGAGREVFLRVDQSGRHDHLTEIQFPIQRLLLEDKHDDRT